LNPAQPLGTPTRRRGHTRAEPHKLRKPAPPQAITPLHTRARAHQLRNSGKTTSTFLVGNLLAGHLKLRVVAVDANPDFGTLARLSPDRRRSEQSLADLLNDADRLKTAAELNPYVSRQATGPRGGTSAVVLESLAPVQDGRPTVALNKSLQRARGNRIIEESFRSRHLHRCVTLPYDEQLAAMLDAGHYTLDALRRPTRMAI